jgi:hypothetical protein
MDGLGKIRRKKERLHACMGPALVHVHVRVQYVQRERERESSLIVE